MMKSHRISLILAFAFTMMVVAVIAIKLVFPKASRVGGPDVDSASPQAAGMMKRPAGALDRRASSSRTADVLIDKASAMKAIQQIMGDSSLLSRHEALTRYINRLGSEDFMEVIESFKALGFHEEREFIMLMEGWARIDPVAAMDYASGNLLPYKSGTFQFMLATWAQSDPDAALRWAEFNQQDVDYNLSLAGIMRGVAPNDLAKATEILNSLPSSDYRSLQAVSKITPQVAVQGYAVARDWLDAIDPNFRRLAASDLAGILARKDAAETAEWILTLGSDGEINDAAVSVVKVWDKPEFDTIVSWTSKMPDAAQTRVAMEVMGRYAREDPVSASAWLTTMRDKPNYDSVVGRFISATLSSQPEISMTYVAEVSDEQARLPYYKNIFASWRKQDANAANSWLENSSLPETVKIQIRAN